MVILQIQLGIRERFIGRWAILTEEKAASNTAMSFVRESVSHGDFGKSLKSLMQQVAKLYN